MNNVLPMASRAQHYSLRRMREAHLQNPNQQQQGVYCHLKQYTEIESLSSRIR